MNTNSSIGERIFKLMKHYGLNKNSLTTKIAMSSNSVIGRLVNDPDRTPSFDILKAIIEKHPEVNARWLVTGYGDMLGKEATTIDKGEVRYFKISAGEPFPENLNGRATAIFTIKGFTDCDFAFDVFGDSMAPRFKSGDIIICDSQDKPKQFGEPYYIVHNGVSNIRNIKNKTPHDTYKVGAENPRFDDYEIEISDIKFLFSVKGLIRREVF